MYNAFFGLTEKPFSITPNPRYLYLSRRHADALAHLVYGISESGGFIQLTGEVGTGKTTLIRSVLEQLPARAEIALVLNPQLSAIGFLENIFEELSISLPAERSARSLIAALNAYLLDAHAQGRRVVLIVDEAQTLGPELLEQVRLLTNLETPTQKLLQIILIGQPELRDLLQRPEMRQIAQRITGRFHLEPLTRAETAEYVAHRMRIAGCQRTVFQASAIRELFRRSKGIPRLINVIADRTLLAAYARDRQQADGTLVRRAAAEVFGRRLMPAPVMALSAAAAACLGVAAVLMLQPPIGVFGTSATATAPGQSVAQAAGRPPGSTQNGAGAQGHDARHGPVGDDARDVRAGGAAPEAQSEPAPNARRSAGEPAVGTLLASGASSTAPEHSAGALAPVAETRKLPATLHAAADATDTDTAFVTLFSLWNAHYDRARGEPCAQAATQQLKCLFQSRGSIAQLRNLDRPAILTLTDADGVEHNVVITSLGYDDATLALGDDSVTIALSELTHHWFGDHLILWRPPAEAPGTLAPGSQGRDILWLRRALAEVRNEDSIDPSPVYDAALETRVRQYQRERMLTVDGIVGAMTQLALMSDLGQPSAPTLRADY